MNTEIIKNVIEDNKAKYCKAIGCKRNFWDPRFCDSPSAVQTRDYLMKLREKGENFGTLAKKMEVGTSVISMAAGGNAGNRPVAKFEGLSMTQYVVKRLGEILKSHDDEVYF